MASIPGGSLNVLPSADLPYPVNIGSGENVLRTDNCGVTFQIEGNKHLIAAAVLEEGMRQGSGVISPDSYKYRLGAISFVFKNHVLVDVEHHYRAEDFYDCPALIEKRTEVFELIEIMRKMLKMKVFL